MSKTPKLNWGLPLPGQDPWYDEFVDLMGAVDGSVYAAREDRNIVLSGGGTLTFNATTNLLSWSAALELLAPISGVVWSVAAGNVTIVDNDIFYVSLVRGPILSQTLAVKNASSVPSDDTSLLIAYRKGDRVFFRNGKVILDGETVALLQNGTGAGSGFTIAGDGLVSGGVTVSVGDGAGIATTSDAIAVDLATNPALEFDAGGAAGKLRVLVAPAGAIVRDGNGISVKVDSTTDAAQPTVGVTAAGVRTLGLPAAFTVEGVAVGAAVTAARLTALMDGSTVVLADSHFHSDQTGTAVTNTLWNLVGAAALLVGDPVEISATASRVQKADATLPATAKVMAVAATADPGGVGAASFTAVSHGLVEAVWGGTGTPSEEIWLAAGGGLTNVEPVAAGQRKVRIGWAYNTNDLWVQIHDFGTI